MDMDISMDIHAKSVDMDMDIYEKFHIHDNPVDNAAPDLHESRCW